MENAAKGVTTPEIVTEEIVATTEEIAAEVKEEVAHVEAHTYGVGGGCGHGSHDDG